MIDYAWIQLASGKPFNLEGPDCPVSIEDVADGLSKINRFAGATRVPYSVAQHSVLVSKIAGKLRHDNCPYAQLHALLHDVHEIVLTDIPTPVKSMLDDGRLSDLEHEVQRRILRGLHLSDIALSSYGTTKQADMIALATEKRDLMAPQQRSWGQWVLPEPLKRKVRPVGWRIARRMFLDRYKALTDAIAADRPVNPHEE